MKTLIIQRFLLDLQKPSVVLASSKIIHPASPLINLTPHDPQSHGR